MEPRPSGERLALILWLARDLGKEKCFANKYFILISRVIEKCILVPGTFPREWASRTSPWHSVSGRKPRGGHSPDLPGGVAGAVSNIYEGMNTEIWAAASRPVICTEP